MPPIDPKDWWLAAAAATSIVTPLAEAAIAPGERVGVVTAVRPTIRSTSGDRVLYVGNDISFGERLATDGNGVIHILFMDQSSITLGPNTEMTIDEFVFHPEKKQGSITVNLVKGFLRVVGGFVSKYSDTRIVTGNATLGIRGGITIVEARSDQTRGIFLFGKHMQMSSGDGQISQTVIRPGFGLTGGAGGVSDPMRIPVAEFSGILDRFENRASIAGRPGAPAPSGQLLSTNDRPGGIGTPDSTLAVDRLDTSFRNINTDDPRRSLRNVLGTGEIPIQS